MSARIGKDKFDEVKEMTGFCKSTEFIAKKCGVSKATVNRVKNAKDYADFTEWSKKSIESRMKKKAAKVAITEKPAAEQVENPVIVSFDQFKALAKDVDAIKVMMGQMLALSGELLNVWKEG